MHLLDVFRWVTNLLLQSFGVTLWLYWAVTFALLEIEMRSGFEALECRRVFACDIPLGAMDAHEAGDIDGDGLSDVVIGKTSQSGNGSLSGTIEVIYSNGAPVMSTPGTSGIREVQEFTIELSQEEIDSWLPEDLIFGYDVYYRDDLDYDGDADLIVVWYGQDHSYYPQLLTEFKIERISQERWEDFLQRRHLSWDFDFNSGWEPGVFFDWDGDGAKDRVDGDCVDLGEFGPAFFQPPVVRGYFDHGEIVLESSSPVYSLGFDYYTTGGNGPYVRGLERSVEFNDRYITEIEIDGVYRTGLLFRGYLDEIEIRWHDVDSNGSISTQYVQFEIPENAPCGLGRHVGDVNGDKSVEFQDFLTVARNYGATDAAFADGDLNCDGTVDFADFLIVSRAYGRTWD